MIQKLLIGLSLLGGVFAASVHAQEAVAHFGAQGATRSITLRTTTDIAVLAPTMRDFLANRPDLALRYEQWGSNDLYALTELDCKTGRPGADIVISSGVHQMVKLVNDGCAVSWVSPETQALPDRLRWRDQVWGISREPAVIVYNRNLVPPEDVPDSRFDLLDLLRPEGSRYGGRVATYDIAASGLGFLFAFMDSQEASTFGALMEAFARSGAVATCCSAEIIGGVATGDYLIAYNVLGSYAMQAARSDQRLGIVAPADYTLVLSRAAILPGTEANHDAGDLLDFILSESGQRSMAKVHLASAPSAPLPGADREEDDSRWRLIELGPTLLVAMDQMKTAGFLARWRAAIGE
ncbi:iron(III) transport system substrate-binding protein [Rhodobacter sp. JA431]|uniref:ABC transporter substrate-binding protein n=1 Tax=Rhodobacter sp. JA431 TaxID=570013 RepID=UPI000BC45516|nr:ABC transporter substrate-binding protein [Rhodobacter sp. JA431]SOB91367.1 iron(III) transport system substrate-binding protein [Rhodobacter sp. JA431]